MEKIIFRCRVINLRIGNIIKQEKLIREETGLFPNHNSYKDEIYYEQYNCYIPIFDNILGRIKNYRTYFWYIYKDNPGYWKPLEHCSLEDFEKYIKPRLKRFYAEI